MRVLLFAIPYRETAHVEVGQSYVDALNNVLIHAAMFICSSIGIWKYVG